MSLFHLLLFAVQWEVSGSQRLIFVLPYLVDRHGKFDLRGSQANAPMLAYNTSLSTIAVVRRVLEAVLPTDIFHPRPEKQNKENNNDNRSTNCVFDTHTKHVCSSKTYGACHLPYSPPVAFIKFPWVRLSGDRGWLGTHSWPSDVT